MELLLLLSLLLLLLLAAAFDASSGPDAPPILLTDPHCFNTGEDAVCEAAWQMQRIGSGCADGDPISGILPGSSWYCKLAKEEAVAVAAGRTVTFVAANQLQPPSTLRLGRRDGMPAPALWSSCDYCALRAADGSGLLEVELYDQAWDKTAGDGEYSSYGEHNGHKGQEAGYNRFKGREGRLALAQTNWAPFFHKERHTHPRSRIEGTFAPEALDKKNCARWIEAPTFVFHMLTWHVGHLLVDVLEPLHHTMLRELGNVSTDVILVLDVANPPEKAVLHAALLNDVYGDEEPFQLLRAFTRHPIHTMSALAALPGKTCFRRLFLGLDPSNTFTSEGWLRRFHDHDSDSRRGGLYGGGSEAGSGGGGGGSGDSKAVAWHHHLAILDPAANTAHLPVSEAYGRFRSFLVPWALRAAGLDPSSGEPAAVTDARGDALAAEKGTCTGVASGGLSCNGEAGSLEPLAVDSGGGGNGCDGGGGCGGGGGGVGGISVAIIRRVASRRVSNMDALVAATTAAAALPAGSTVEQLRLETMPWRQQLAVLQRADVLIGQLGTGMHNVMFMRPGSVAVLLMPPEWCAWSWQVADQAVAAGVHVLLSCHEAEAPATRRRWRRWRWCERCWRQGPWYTRYKSFAVDEELFLGLLQDAAALVAAGDASGPPRLQQLALQTWKDAVLSADVADAALPAARARVAHVKTSWAADGGVLLAVVAEIVTNLSPVELGLEAATSAAAAAAAAAAASALGLPPATGSGGGIGGGGQKEDRGLRLCVQLWLGGDAIAEACFAPTDMNEHADIALDVPPEFLSSGATREILAMMWLQWGASGGRTIPGSEDYYPISIAAAGGAAAGALPHVFLWDDIAPVDNAKAVVIVDGLPPPPTAVSSALPEAASAVPADDPAAPQGNFAAPSPAAVLSASLAHELLLQRDLAAFCHAQVPPLAPPSCGIVAAHAYRQARAAAAAAAEGLPAVTVLPTPSRPFVFLHLEKCGGTSVRVMLVETALNRGLHFFAPCFTETAGYDPVPASCAQFGLKGVPEISRTQLQVVAMHPERGWDLWKELPSVRSDDDLDCFVMLRHPVERAIAYYYERVFVLTEGRFTPLTTTPLNEQPLEELASLMALARGLTAPGFLDPRNHSVQAFIDEGMSNAACKMLTGAPPGRRSPVSSLGGSFPAPPPYDLSVAMRRLGRCVVGLQERWADTLPVLTHFFPWLNTRDPGVLNHSWWRSIGPREAREGLRPDILQLILEHNRCDMALYEAAEARFDAQLRVIEIARR